MDKKEIIDILESFAENEKHIGFYSATREEVEAMEFAIKYMKDH